MRCAVAILGAFAAIGCGVSGVHAASVLDTGFSTTRLDRMCLAPPHRLNIQLMWQDRINADLDLHIRRPDGRHVYYRDRGLDRCSGVLDHDRLKGSRFNLPETFFVEHAECPAPDGDYQVWVHYFSGRLRSVPFTLSLQIGDTVQILCRGTMSSEVSRRTTVPFSIPADLAAAGPAGLSLPDWCE